MLRPTRLPLLLLILPLAACSFETTGLKPGEARLRVENRSQAPVVAVHISACQDANRGANLLAPDEIPADADRSFDIDPGCYDVLVRNAPGAESTYDGLIINGGVTHTVTFVGT